MTANREQKLKNIIKKVAAEFIQKESNHISIITITDVSLSEKNNKATIFFTVLPENKESGVIDFCKRKRTEFREFFKNHSRMRSLPFFDFEIDKGEKNRQKIDDIARNVVK